MKPRLTSRSQAGMAMIAAHLAVLPLPAPVGAQGTEPLVIHRLSSPVVRLRYSVAEGTDVWLVYNEGLDPDRTRQALEPLSPFSLSRSVILKYSHTIGL